MLHIRARLEDWGAGVRLNVLKREDRTSYYISDVVFTEVSEAAERPHSPLFLENEEAQALIDSLWNCGFRPTEGTGSAGSLKATENHLHDMRKIAFKKLSIE